MAYPSPTTVNATQGLDSFLPYLSEVTNFWFGRMIVIAVWVIFLFGYLTVKRDDIIGGSAVASYVTFVIGLIFWVLGLISGIDFAVVIGLSVITTIILLVQKKN